MRAAIIGISGLRLTLEEAALLRRHRPMGAILFARNVADPDQLRALTAELREVLGAAAPILVDQEGGRVARLKPPHWPKHPPAATFENGPAGAARAEAAAIGAECAAVGLDVVCAPLLDLRLPGMHQVIGDRAFSADPAEVARLGAAWIAGLRDGGALPVIKHIPGHGRAMMDSHEALPVVEASREELALDFAPFRALAADDLWAMTAHILYPALDPERCATLSPTVIDGVIRGEIGFGGFLVSDDLGMKALKGDFGQLTQAVMAAGCDAALHCSGVLAETAAVLEACPPLTDAARDRLALSRAGVPA
ncbi:beta-N-acetylhexosaminidase [Roseococcus sp. SYP-B2431]|uniref:beta-N-acetylhexosaminidase n=1 Tax=Roseococcus sp. SYP-B2431 TaxID=2496640 RepID=UPI00103AF633|nr:beta-N-acetylhexosaminidase [Roseococcus sp. SYP-B2431]TCH97700.1 beta-N-acetylhexosaminidase [Roseococcus sp. SYP-B2431]